MSFLIQFGRNAFVTILLAAAALASTVCFADCQDLLQTSDFEIFATHSQAAAPSRDMTPILFELFPYFSKGFREPQFYQILAKHPEFLKKRLHQWYGEPQRRIAGWEKEFGPLLPLLLDPGIHYRLKAFRKFVSKLPIEDRQDPGHVRQLFSDSLGSVTVYRGLRVYREEFQKNPESAHRPHSGYAAGALTSSSIYNFSRFMMRGPRGDIEERMMATGWGHFSQSMTGIETLARGFATNRLEDPGEPSPSNAAPVLIQAEIPRLDLLTYKMVGGFYGGRLIEKLSFYKANGRLIWGGRKGLEYFVIGEFNPSWINSVAEIPAESGIDTWYLFGLIPMR